MIHVDPALIAPTPRPAPATAPAAARTLIETQMAVLTRLTQIGMEVAEACGRDAVRASATADQGAAEPATHRDPGLAFARVARAVRMTIALQSRLAKDLAALDRAGEQAEAARRSRRRMRLSSLVADAARTLVEARRRAEGQDGDDEDAAEDEIEQMAEVAYERLTDAEDGDLDGLSFGEAVAGVCRDLGLSPERTARLLATMEPPLTSPIAERWREGDREAVEGAGQERRRQSKLLGLSPSTIGFTADGPPPAARSAGEVSHSGFS